MSANCTQYSRNKLSKVLKNELGATHQGLFRLRCTTKKVR